jgi:hypothetical protein
MMPTFGFPKEEMAEFPNALLPALSFGLAHVPG